MHKAPTWWGWGGKMYALSFIPTSRKTVSRSQDSNLTIARRLTLINLQYYMIENRSKNAIYHLNLAIQNNVTITTHHYISRYLSQARQFLAQDYF